MSSPGIFYLYFSDLIVVTWLHFTSIFSDSDESDSDDDFDSSSEEEDDDEDGVEHLDLNICPPGCR